MDVTIFYVATYITPYMSFNGEMNTRFMRYLSIESNDKHHVTYFYRQCGNTWSDRLYSTLIEYTFEKLNNI